MRRLIADLVTRLEAGETFALASLVHSQGSTPQRPGAKALFLPDGRILGTLGGGCLEMEARRRALEALRTGRPELVDIRLDGDYGFDDGLICGGIARVFIDPRPHASLDALRLLADAVRAERSGLLVATVAGPDDDLLGEQRYLPDSCLSAAGAGLPLPEEALAVARECLVTGLPELVTVDGSAGPTTYYLEPYPRRPTLLIVGAGHVGQALARLAADLDFRTVVLDDRSAFASAQRFPQADEILVEDIPSALSRYPLDPSTYVVIVTRGHRHDGQALRCCLARGAGYLGMIGSRRKIRVIYEGLVAERCATWEELQRVHAPIGLDIGAVSVEEIALSIAAELVLLRRRGLDGDGDRAGRRQVPTYGAVQASASPRGPDGGGEGRRRPSRCAG